MKFSEFVSLVKSDLKNYGAKTFKERLYVFFFNFNFGLLYSYRLMKYLSNKRFFFRLNLLVAYWQNFKYNSYISVKAEIGKNVIFTHSFGVIIGQAKIGDNVKIFHQVTIGSHGNKSLAKSYPTIGNNCILYSGSKILGNTVVGDSSVIGANAVVTKNIPKNCVAVGIPARVIKKYNDIEKKWDRLD